MNEATGGQRSTRALTDAAWDGARQFASELMATSRRAVADNSAHAMNMWERASQGEYDVADWVQDVTLFWERVARDSAKTVVAAAKFASSLRPERSQQ